MIVRVQSKNGTKRISALPTDTLQSFLEKVIQEFGLSPTESFSLFLSPGHRDELTSTHLEQTLKSIPLNHGDMLYLLERSSTLVPVSSEPGVGDTVAGMGDTVAEDNIDTILRRKDGKIHRQRDPQLCHHGALGKCLNCVPLEPWDKKFLDSRDPPIKHLSFHCYLRKLTSGVDRGKFVNLEDLSCKIKPGCQEHPPWPAGICTKCQPSAITLARQTYRHVDNVMFEDRKIVERFLEGWRKSGAQRIGYLYGDYEEYADVPLGIKAVVAAIYEPPQVSTKYAVELLEDPQEESVRDLAALLGLRKVGWIFTDLEHEAKGTVAYKRSIHTHLLSAEECIMAAEFQNTHPSPCRVAKSGFFGSKFVTVCVSGNESKQVDLSGYQVSNQCMALVRDDCLVPTLDAPELGYIRESTSEQYVPDVFYKMKGEYGSEVTKLARPLPLEYLLVDLTTTTPLQPKPFLVGGKEPLFPIENRAGIGLQIQDFSSLSSYLHNQQTSNFLCYMSDFHLLLYLYTDTELGLRFKSHLPALCQAIRQQDRALAEQWRRQECWATVEQLLLASEPSPNTVDGASRFPPPPPSAVSPAGGSGGSWACKHCTLLNPPHLAECDACHLPRT